MTCHIDINPGNDLSVEFTDYKLLNKKKKSFMNNKQVQS